MLLGLECKSRGRGAAGSSVFLLLAACESGGLASHRVRVPAKLAITVQPTASIVGAAIRPAVAVTVLDAHGNTATSATTSITLALGSNPAGSTLSGKLTTAAVNGVEEIHPRRWKRAGEQVQRKVP